MTRNENQSAVNMSGDERKEHGLIVSFESPTGDRLTLHGTGAANDVLRALCAEALRRDPDLRVVAISSPSTIWADITGRKVCANGRAEAVERSPSTPEAGMLGRAGLQVMLHPRLRGSAGHGDNRAWELVDARSESALAEIAGR